MTRTRLPLPALLLLLALLVALRPGVAGAETIRLAVGQRGNWDTSVAEIGRQLGIFARHGLEPEILYTAGGAETQQAVLARSVDVGVAVGTLAVLGAASKGAPVRVIGGEMTGAAEMFWYVPAASPIQGPQDLAGRTVGFSTVGSSSDMVLRLAAARLGVAMRPVATGSAAATYTQTMSGQIDVGWSSAPFGVEALRNGTVRTVLRGTDVGPAADQTIRVLVTHAAVLGARRPLLARFMAAYRETVDAMYADDAALRAYAAFAGVPDAVARDTRDTFFPKAALDPGRITGLDAMMADAVRFRFMAEPLSPDQLRPLLALESLRP